jgi:hypothetical protein
VLIDIKEISAAQMLIPAGITGVDRSRKDAQGELCVHQILAVGVDRGGVVGKNAFHMRDHEVFDFKSDLGMCQVDLPLGIGFCCGSHHDELVFSDE